MSCTITIIPAREFFRTKANGEFDLDATRKASFDVFSRMKDLNVSEVLLDHRQTSTQMTASDLLTLFKELHLGGFLKARKIAILNHPKRDFDPDKFFAACAQTKGYQIAAFHDFEEAVIWLYPPEDVT
jgi:hypothetical protein